MSQVCYKHPRYTQYFIVIIVLLYNHSTPWHISRGLANTLTSVLEKHLYTRRAAGCGLGSNQGLFGWQRRKAAWARHHSQAFDFERLGSDVHAWPALPGQGCIQTCPTCQRLTTYTIFRPLMRRQHVAKQDCHGKNVLSCMLQEEMWKKERHGILSRVYLFFREHM